MRRIVLSGLAFLLAAALLVRIARSKPAAPGASAPAGKNDPLVFVFLRIDTQRNLAILRPMIAPDIGVQLDSGPRQLEKHTMLQCRATSRERDALVDGQIGKFSETLLDCGQYKFALKGIDFSPQR